jgi:hypothetical protein
MAARIPITVDLRGLSFGRNTTVSNVLTPKVRRAPYNENGESNLNTPAELLMLSKMHAVNPNHLDVVECWKGPSHTRALELAMWYQFLHACLHNEVKDYLTEGVVKDLLARSGKSLLSSFREPRRSPSVDCSLQRFYQSTRAVSAAAKPPANISQNRSKRFTSSPIFLSISVASRSASWISTSLMSSTA